MGNLVLYLHGKGGSADESRHYVPLFPGWDVIGLDYRSDTPWEAGREIRGAVGRLKARYDRIDLVANSIGAFFAMHADIGSWIRRAYLISPVADMERLILGMMLMENVTEAELKARETIRTASGETLSWAYLCYVREHPVRWPVPTWILYGAGDRLTDRETMIRFAQVNGAKLTIMEEGEHWFHTEEQMAFLDRWIVTSKGESEKDPPPSAPQDVKGE